MNKTWISFSALFVVLLCAGFAIADESLPKVIFDQGHNQQFLIGEKGELQLSNLADIIRGKGGEVVATSEALSDNTLLDATALVISGPFAQLQAEEVEAVARFVERGGHLAVMLHIGPPLAGLLERLDIDHSNAVLHERSNVIDKDINFRVGELTPHQLFSGVSSFSVYGGWALKSGREGAAIALTSAGSWIDLDGNRILTKGDALGPFEIVIAGSFGAGSFVVFGDDAIFQNRYLDQDNAKLAANLADMLIGR
ncbi:MAG: hypothetical protein A2X82_02975 [Geobacteraceae bacterium GWC2_55_20]|nr:MAG: hypothetical protein A2X82_02975 [Geobacteraceae bacterium GWC2_55_20]OGU19591.1 MAG: hypothetical protein A2X85_08460 [Geobacteraceae bacterium GWF2_54_21]HBA71329.1 hypothetical protein [Geobacter sp.]HCE68735.1 hypothetical protein [Geobacter sp.]